MDRRLIVFVKAPRLGRAKTRLSRDIGAVEACRFYRVETARLLRRLAPDPRWRTVVAVSPDGERGRIGTGLDPWPASILRMPQGPGDLGRRMERCLLTGHAGPQVLIGSDIPAIGPDHVERAFRALGNAPAVFGPAEDGGFWLIGLARASLARGLFNGVRLSTPHALEDTLARLINRLPVRLVDRLADIDTGADLARWRGHRSGNP
ncbi:MAG: TIGR04282 family arsenosugar biosynthesis glycosyltransferase [Alphaproteobacteria bacterium]